MGYFSILMVSVGLAMDALAVAVCMGISAKNFSIRNCLMVGVYFGLFQAIMPLIGYFLGRGMKTFVFAVDHLVAFSLLVIIGANMIYEACCSNKKEFSQEFNFKSLLLPAFATSMDAFSVGITFAFFEVNLLLSILTIGVIAFCFSFMGVYIGGNIGNRNSNIAQIIGGLILIGMGIKILIEHL